MAHLIDTYADRLIDVLHTFAGPRFFKQEILEVSGLLTAILITYDEVLDDVRGARQVSWDEFLDGMSSVKADWKHFDKAMMESLAQKPDKSIGGWEGRTIYFIRGGQNADQWSVDAAEEDALKLLAASHVLLPNLVQMEVQELRERIPVGRERFREYEDHVRIVFQFLFRKQLEDGKGQSRTAPENEGVEIRDVIFANVASTGFWKDLKEKYGATEIVIDAKNTDELTREDLRQLYCYLKPALGYWGFIVCRSEPPDVIEAFNRTLFKNFKQERGVLILCDDDLRRMVQLAVLGNDPSEYLQTKMSKFARSV